MSTDWKNYMSKKNKKNKIQRDNGFFVASPPKTPTPSAAGLH
jgi:hypothetical protein